MLIVRSSLGSVSELTLALTMAEQNKQVENAFRNDRNKLLGFIRKQVPTADDAEDLLQDVFVSLTASTEPIAEVTNWLYRVARNRIIDWYRKKKTVTMSKLSGGDAASEQRIMETLLPSVNDPDADLLRSTFWEALNGSLDELPASQREVFVMHELDGLSFKQIAELTGTPLNTLLTRKHYAVRELRESLRSLYNEMIES